MNVTPKTILFQTYVINKITMYWDVKEITSDNLATMHIEIVVLDKNRINADQSIGLIRIGPNHGYVDKHWEEMLKTPGEMVAKLHALRDI